MALPDFEPILGSWPSGQRGLMDAFLDLARAALSWPDVQPSLVSREGVSHSFRAGGGQPDRTRPVFFLVDVVVSAADPWFLSVCFYENEITDPDGLGNPIPKGLFDETGYCFDVDDYDADQIQYLKDRLAEARQAAFGR
jgi:hypothetical protein